MKRSFANILPKGSVLVFSLLILSIMLVTSLTILSSAVLDRKASLSTGSSTRSFQVADSGVEEVLYQIYKETRATPNAIASAITGGSCLNGVISFPVAGGDAEVTLYQDETTVFTDCTDANWRDSVVKIKSEGTAGPTTRAVEVAVAASGGGITGGCEADDTGGGNYNIKNKWGQGCDNNGTSFAAGASNACLGAADTGYSCGPASRNPEDNINWFCNCVSN